jgi:hypothetical protein
MFVHLGSKMHENKSLMCSIQHFSNNKTPLILGVITFSFEFRIKCYKGLVVLWLKGHLNSWKTYCKKCTVTKLKEI